ncbi:hypothetical protein V6N13_019012 [Hibiscus sabdariffa]
MEPLRKQRKPDLIMDPNILLSSSISYDEMGKYERYTRMITSLIPLTKSLAQQKRDRHTKSLGIRYIKTLAAQTLFPPLDLRRLLLAREQGCAIFRLFRKEFLSSCSLVYSGGLSRDLDEIFVEIQDPSKWFHQENKSCDFLRVFFCLVRFLRDSKNEGVRSET